MLPFFDRRSGVMAAALDLKSSGEIREGSNPSSGTIHDFALISCLNIGPFGHPNGVLS